VTARWAGGMTTPETPEPPVPPPGDGPPPGRRRARLRLARALLRSVRWGLGTLTRFALLWLLGTLVLGVIVALVPGIHAEGPAAVAGAAVLVCAATAVLRPLLAAAAVALSWVGVFVVGLLSQALIVWVGLTIAPGVEVDGLGAAFVGAWVYALVGAVLSWLLLVDDDAALLGHVMRSATRGGGPPPDDGKDGVVVVQIDGLPFPLLQLLVNAGDLPTISRWVRGGSHRMRSWTARVPCTTPVSQAGILHGETADLPAFRWYEKDSRRLLVANRPADAAEIERRVSDGRGLLADDGASIGNLFSGDAAVSLLTMSGMSRGRSGLGPSRSYASFFVHPFGFTRSITLVVGELAKELYQGRRQRVRGIEPRVHRGGAYVVLRAVTNVLLRDLNLALVAEQLMLGRRVVYVDFVDYDEIAHHAGPVRAESVAAVVGLDRMLASLERVAEQAPRRYHLVVLSDHGQSQGATFRQRYGHGLADVVGDLMGRDPVEVTSSVEDWGPVNTFLTQLGQQAGVSAGLVRRTYRRGARDAGAPLGPVDAEASAARQPGEAVVVGSGNLGLVWLPAGPGRLDLTRMEELYPGLVGALANHPGIGWLMADDGGEPVVIGRGGLHHLADGRVDGEDPLAPFGPGAAADLLRLSGFRTAPDLYLGSVVDPETGDVAAFEELVGCHGGLGGWQQQAVLVHPAGWPVDELEAPGAEALHRQLVAWLEALGHRDGLAPPARVTSGSASRPVRAASGGAAGGPADGAAGAGSAHDGADAARGHRRDEAADTDADRDVDQRRRHL
jgi:uncharacterized membrane protein YvlD (DUF360 family)